MNINELEKIILKYVKSKYLPKRFAKFAGSPFCDRDLEIFAPATMDLSDAFTIEREELPRAYFNKPEFRSSYLIYFTLTNIAKLAHILKLPETTNIFDARDSIKLLDIGCGPAVGALASVIAFPNKAIEIFGLEQNRNILEDGVEIFKSVKCARQGFHPIVDRYDVKKGFPQAVTKNGPFDIIIASNLINEIDDRFSFDFLSKIFNMLSQDGVVILIEPALQMTTRRLMRLRDQLLATKKVKVLSPCLHGGPCPMLTWNQRDWCHSYIEWKKPKVIGDIDELIGIKHDYLKLSYLVLSHLHKISKDKSLDVNSYRVVSSILKSKGKVELLLCSATGKMIKAVRQDKDRSEKNYDIERAKRGDIVSIDREKLLKHDYFRIIEKFNKTIH